MRYFDLYVDNTNSFYTYCDEFDRYKIGERVAVNFRNREYGAFIIAENRNETFDFKVLPIKRKLEQEISLEKSYVNMLLWTSEYYLTKFSQILKAAIPLNLKIQYEENYILTDIGRNDILNPLVQYFLEKEFVGKSTLRKKFCNDFINNMIQEKILYKNIDGKISYNYQLHDSNKSFDEEKIKSLKTYFLKKSK